MNLAGFEMKIRYLIVLLFSAVLAGCAGAPRKPWWYSADVKAPLVRHTPGSVYSLQNTQDIFSDVRAHRVGDIITVLINEQAVASKQASTQINRQGSINNSAAAILGSTNPGRFNIKTGSNNKFSGSGQAAQQNSFSTTLTAMVIHVLPSGNLVIAGKKRVVLDHGPETIAIRGIVRPSAIGPSNTVTSSQVADATIRYTGSGVMQSAQRMGWLQRILIDIWPF